MNVNNTPSAAAGQTYSVSPQPVQAQGNCFGKVVVCDDGSAKIYCPKSDGSSEEKATVFRDSPIRSATFSADGTQVLMTSQDGTTRTFGRDADGVFFEQGTSMKK
ncbi:MULTISPECIES: hypothetical protein [unclassified Endozoicomonas]|uniref:hypothetical protein n=1 Tax=unclassified Endozoicomonas TaxID=2644528 RepID=UPI002147F482|nr:MULTISPECIES: hypothetical protein [unclassified Endozoicomonas]